MKTVFPLEPTLVSKAVYFGLQQTEQILWGREPLNLINLTLMDQGLGPGPFKVQSSHADETRRGRPEILRVVK